MKKSDTLDFIEHTAIIVGTSKDKRTLDMKLLGIIECDSCPAADICKLSKSSDKVFSTVTPLAAQLKEGDKVGVRGIEILPHRFLVVATVLPCLILITSMIIVFLLTFNQVLALICGIGITLIIFVLIWASRNKVAHEFQFSIVRSNNRK